MRRVSDGDPLYIPAQTWNQLVAGLERGDGAGPGQSRGFRPTLTCWVRNETGVDLPRFGVVGIDEPLISPTDNEAEFLNAIAFSGVLAAGSDFELKWGLTVEPIVSGEIGLVTIQGLSYALIDTADPETAGPTDDGDVTALTSATCGLARVLWRDSGSGNKWAIVCLG